MDSTLSKLDATELVGEEYNELIVKRIHCFLLIESIANNTSARKKADGYLELRTLFLQGTKYTSGITASILNGLWIGR
jgi:hypothetical protein